MFSHFGWHVTPTFHASFAHVKPSDVKSAPAASDPHARLRYSRVVGRQQEVEQQADGLLHVDLVGGGHALAQLVEDGGQHHFQTGHGELSVDVHGVQPVLAEGLDDVPDVDQVHWKRSDTAWALSPEEVMSEQDKTHGCISSAQIAVCRRFCMLTTVWNPNPGPLRKILIVLWNKNNWKSGINRRIHVWKYDMRTSSIGPLKKMSKI